MMKASLKPTNLRPALVFHILAGTIACLEKSFMHLTYKLSYSGNIGCWKSNRLALATNYDTHLVSILFDVRLWRISYIFFPSFPFLSP